MRVKTIRPAISVRWSHDQSLTGDVDAIRSDGRLLVRWHKCGHTGWFTRQELKVQTSDTKQLTRAAHA